MDSSGQNIFFPLVEQQASHTFDIHADRTQEMFWSSGGTRCVPSLPECPMLFQRESNSLSQKSPLRILTPIKQSK